MTEDLDRTDLDIVAALSRDGRRSFRDVAREVGVSEGTVRARVARMQEQGYLRICAVGSPTALGVACNAMVLLKVKPPAISEAAERLAALTHVRFVGVTMGSSDIVIQTLHGSFEELFTFVSETIPDLVPDVVETETLHVARVLKSEWNWAEWFREGLLAAPTGAGRVSANEASDPAADAVGRRL